MIRDIRHFTLPNCRQKNLFQIFEAEINIMHIKLPHSVIVKSPGLLPMLYTVRELADAIGVHERTLRDWLMAGAPHSRARKGHSWINGREFAKWVVSMRKPKRERKLKDHEAFCLRCNEVVEMVNPKVNHIRGKLFVHRGKCPKCKCTINRGGRMPNNFNAEKDRKDQHYDAKEKEKSREVN
jgi:hypothetical protein